jgi:UPF0755 protein
MKRLFMLLLIVGVVAAGGLWWVRARLVTPYRGFDTPEVFFEVRPGAGVGEIARQLAAAGIVPDELTFRVAARVSGSDRRLQAGEYRFADPSSPLEVLDRLARGDVFTRPLTFPEGMTIREMAQVFERASLGRAADFERAAADGSLLGELDPGAPDLEGYLFPDTYALSRTPGAAGTVRAMVERFRQAFNADLRAEAARLDMSLREVVTLASLIEKETAAESERPIVSAVYHNRLARRMPLQCDPTVIYALMKAGRWRGNLTRADLQMDSPYNTYRFPGLPPGPIASPGLASLQAAVRPADVPYLYFVSRNDGTHVFASTLAEHNRNVQEWQIRFFRRQSSTGN